MIWRTNKEGDRRERIIFAWLPKECEDGKTRWLEKVRVVEEWGTWGFDPETMHIGWNVLKTYQAEYEPRRAGPKS